MPKRRMLPLWDLKPCLWKIDADANKEHDMGMMSSYRKFNPAGLLIVLFNCWIMYPGAAQEENLDVFHQWVLQNNPGSMLIHDLIRQANDHYGRRDTAIANLNSKQDWLMRQALVREKLSALLGPFPEKTPLHVRVTGVLNKHGYRVEKIIYESMPDFYVTGCLFLPEKIEGKVPAVLNVIGHNQEAFRAELYQRLILNLVDKGMIVLAIDPIGQGEHVQYYDPRIDFSSIGYSVIEHCYLGNQCFLSGIAPCRYFIWDGIRGIDYLLTREEVDPERIGVTGFSGGGTVSAYIAAYDDRVKVSVPCSWSTASRRQLETKGVQDAETVFIRGVAEGITFEDLLEVRAPKPSLMTFVSRDQYLSIQGARESYREAKKAYDAFGLEQNLELIEDDFEHWMTPKIRSGIYSFFMKHFELTGDPAEKDVSIIPAGELVVTATGQISNSLGGDMVFDVNKRETEKLISELERSRNDLDRHLDLVREKARQLSGFTGTRDRTSEPFLNGRYRGDGYTVAKYAIRGEGDHVIPLLLFVPDGREEKHPALVYLHPEGKAAEAWPGGEIEKLVRGGYIVAAVDPAGMGETRNTATRALGPGYTALLIGRSIVGMQADDIVRTVDYLKGRADVDGHSIGAVAVGVMCLPLMHAAALDTAIHHVTLIASLISYRCVAMHRYYQIGLIEREGGGTGHPYEVEFNWGIAGVLQGYDLPDLIGCMAPRKLILADLRDHRLKPASDELIEMETGFPRRVYSHKQVAGNLRIVSSFVSLETLVDWAAE
jgi:cephalosporin-C deacetylase-like acetyl esterase